LKFLTLPTAAALALNLGALVESRLAVFGLLAAVIALAAKKDRLSEAAQKLNRWLSMLALALSFAALSSFIVGEALPGIIEARGRDAEQRTVSRLRELLFAEDSMRKGAAIDPDHDRIGSAAFLSELTGAHPARGRIQLKYAPLEARLVPRVPTKAGPALEDGDYLIYICLPRAEGGYTASPGEAIDDERAERSWFAWAWPKSPSVPRALLAIDQDERILRAREGPLRAKQWVGRDEPPPCDLSLLEDSSLFAPWRGKAPRPSLPYSTPSESP
jgi:hypothetical protein